MINSFDLSKDAAIEAECVLYICKYYFCLLKNKENIKVFVVAACSIHRHTHTHALARTTSANCFHTAEAYLGLVAFLFFFNGI